MRFWATIGLLLFLAAAAFADKNASRPMRVPNVTAYPQMVQELRADAARSACVRVVSLGRTRDRRDIWLARLADPACVPQKTVRIVILCRQHGDEPASTESALSLIRRLSLGQDAALRTALKHVTLYLIPMVNPDGAEAMTRVNASGADLNRDWGVFSQPETRAVARAVEIINPHVVMDAHNWDGYDSYNAHSIEVARTLGVKPTPLGDEGRELQQAAVAQLARSGYQVQSTAYGSNADTRLAHRYFARQGRLAFLVETHSGDPRDLADFQQRQGMYTALIHGLARRYSGKGDAQRLALEHLENGLTLTTEDARLFPAPAARLAAAHPVHQSLLWIGAICLYAFALWAAAQGHRSPLVTPAPPVRPAARRYYA